MSPPNTPDRSECDCSVDQSEAGRCRTIIAQTAATQARETAHAMNNLQLQVAQHQERLRQVELEWQQERKTREEMTTKCRQSGFAAQQAELARRELEVKLRSERAKNLEIQKTFEFHEESRANTERHLSETWRTIEKLADVIHCLRNHLDGDRLQPEERHVDVAAILMEKEQLRIENGGLKNMLLESKFASRTASEGFEAQLERERQESQHHLKAKDERIIALEKALRSKDARRARASQKKISGV